MEKSLLPKYGEKVFSGGKDFPGSLLMSFFPKVFLFFPFGENTFLSGPMISEAIGPLQVSPTTLSAQVARGPPSPTAVL